MDKTKKINVLLIDDHMLFRSGVRFLLQRQEDFNVVGEASDGLAGIKLAEKLKPDVVLLDLDMPVMNGREALPQLLSIDTNISVLMLTVSEDGNDLDDCMRMGARGYLLKNINTDFLLDSIRKAVEGDNILSPEMTTKLVNRLKGKEVDAVPKEVETLTPREREILVWLSRGMSNKVIARELDVSDSTVKVHVQNVLRKLNLHGRVQAAIFAVEHGLDKFN